MEPSRFWNRHGGCAGGGAGEPSTPVQQPTTRTQSASYVPRPTPSSAPPTSLNPNRMPNHPLALQQSYNDSPAHGSGVHEPHRGQQLQDLAHGSLATNHAPQHYGAPPSDHSRQPHFTPPVQPSVYYTPQATRSRAWVQPPEWNERLPDPERSMIPAVPEAAKNLPSYIPTPEPTAAEPNLRPVGVPAFHGIIAFVQKTGRSEEERRVLQDAILAYGGQLAAENNPYRGITHLVVAVPEYIRSKRVLGGIEVTVAKPQGDTRPGPRPTANADLVSLIRWFCKFTDDKLRGSTFQVVTQEWVTAAIRRSTFHLNKSWICDFQVFGRWAESTRTTPDIAPRSLPSTTSQQPMAAADSTIRTGGPAGLFFSPASPWSRNEQRSSSPTHSLNSSPCPPPGRRAAQAPSRPSIPVVQSSSSGSERAPPAFSDIIDLTTSPFVPTTASSRGDEQTGGSGVPEGPAEPSVATTGASQTEAQKQAHQSGQSGPEPGLPTSPPQLQGHVQPVLTENVVENNASLTTEQAAPKCPTTLQQVETATRSTASIDGPAEPPAATSEASTTWQTAPGGAPDKSLATRPHQPVVTQMPSARTKAALTNTNTMLQPPTTQPVIAEPALQTESTQTVQGLVAAEQTATLHTGVSRPTIHAEVTAPEVTLTAEAMHSDKVTNVGVGAPADKETRAGVQTPTDGILESPVEKSSGTEVAAEAQKVISTEGSTATDEPAPTQEANVIEGLGTQNGMRQHSVSEGTTAAAAAEPVATKLNSVAKAPTASTTPTLPLVTSTGQQQAIAPNASKRTAGLSRTKRWGSEPLSNANDIWRGPGFQRMFAPLVGQPNCPPETAPTDVPKKASQSSDPPNNTLSPQALEPIIESDPQLFARCKEHEQVKAWMVDCRPSDQLPVTRMGGIIVQSYEECSVVILPLGVGEPVTNPNHIALLKGPYPFMLVRRVVLSRQWPFDCYDQRRFLPLDKYIIELPAIPTPQSSVPPESQEGAGRPVDAPSLLPPESSPAKASVDIPAPCPERSNPASAQIIPTPPDVEMSSNPLDKSVVPPSRENHGGPGAEDTITPSRGENALELTSMKFLEAHNSGALPKNNGSIPSIGQSPRSATPGSDPKPSAGGMCTIRTTVETSDTGRLDMGKSVSPPVLPEAIAAPPNDKPASGANLSNPVVNATPSERPAFSWTADHSTAGPSSSIVQSLGVQPPSGRDMEMSDTSPMELDSPRAALRSTSLSESRPVVGTANAEPVSSIPPGFVTGHSARPASQAHTVAREANAAQTAQTAQQSNVVNPKHFHTFSTTAAPDTQATSFSPTVAVNAHAEPPFQPAPIASAPVGHAPTSISTAPTPSTAAKGKRKKRHPTDSWKSITFGSSAADSVKSRRRTLAAAVPLPQNDGDDDMQPPEAEQAKNTPRAKPQRTYSRRGRPAPIRIDTGIATANPSTPAYRRTSPRKRNAAVAELDASDSRPIFEIALAPGADLHSAASTLPSGPASALLTSASGKDMSAPFVGMQSAPALPAVPPPASQNLKAEAELHAVWTRLLDTCPDRSKYSFKNYLRRASHKEGLRCGEHYREAQLRVFQKHHPEAVRGFNPSALSSADKERERKLKAKEFLRKSPTVSWPSQAHMFAVAELLEVAEEELDDYESLEDFLKLAWVSPRKSSTPTELYARYTDYIHAMCPAIAAKAQQSYSVPAPRVHADLGQSSTSQMPVTVAQGPTRSDTPNPITSVLKDQAGPHHRSSSNLSNPDGETTWETASEGQVDGAVLGPTAHAPQPMAIDWGHRVLYPFGDMQAQQRGTPNLPDEPWRARPGLIAGSNKLPTINPGPYSIDREPGAAPQTASHGTSGYAPYALPMPPEAGPSQPRGAEQPYHPAHGFNPNPDSPSPYPRDIYSLLAPEPSAGPSQPNPVPDRSQQRRYWS